MSAISRGTEGQPPEDQQLSRFGLSGFGNDGLAMRENNFRAGRLRIELSELLENHKRHDSVQIRLFSAVTARVAGLQRPDPEQIGARAGHWQKDFDLRVRPKQPFTRIGVGFPPTGSIAPYV